VKQVQVTVPYEKTEAVYDFLVDVLNIKNIVRFTTDNAHILQFRVAEDDITDTMEGLKSRGVGVEFGFIDIWDLKASLPREISEEAQENITQREATLAVEEIYDNVKKQASLSFDFISFVIFSAVIAGIGLAQNNVTIIVASMLLSPLMGPMLGVALGYVVNDNALFLKGTKNELIALGLSFAVGAVLGALIPPMMAVLSPSATPLMDVVTADMNAGNLTEITRRAGFSALDVGIAIFSGGAVAVSITKGDMSSLVGVAISAALMPPAVNVGMMLMMGAVNASILGIQIGLGSLALLAMNIVIIDVAAIIMFKIKKLGVIADKSATWTAVTQFKQKRPPSLYHTPATSQAASFTAATDSEGEINAEPPKSDSSKEQSG
jgi:uncharacterized hydrophobic protein (TIGR00341 family)